MVSERQTVVFAFVIVTIMIFFSVNIVESYSPPNESNIQLVKLEINDTSHTITKNNIYVSEGDNVIPTVDGKKSKDWVNIEPLSSEPRIDIINNTVYTDNGIECDPNKKVINNDNQDNLNYVIERYKIEYANSEKWLNFYCVNNNT